MYVEYVHCMSIHNKKEKNYIFHHSTRSKMNNFIIITVLSLWFYIIYLKSLRKKKALKLSFDEYSFQITIYQVKCPFRF